MAPSEWTQAWMCDTSRKPCQDGQTHMHICVCTKWSVYFVRGHRCVSGASNEDYMSRRQEGIGACCSFRHMFCLWIGGRPATAHHPAHSSPQLIRWAYHCPTEHDSISGNKIMLQTYYTDTQPFYRNLDPQPMMQSSCTRWCLPRNGQCVQVCMDTITQGAKHAGITKTDVCVCVHSIHAQCAIAWAPLRHTPRFKESSSSWKAGDHLNCSSVKPCLQSRTLHVWGHMH